MTLVASLKQAKLIMDILADRYWGHVVGVYVAGAVALGAWYAVQGDVIVAAALTVVAAYFSLDAIRGWRD